MLHFTNCRTEERIFFYSEGKNHLLNFLFVYSVYVFIAFLSLSLSLSLSPHHHPPHYCFSVPDVSFFWTFLSLCFTFSFISPFLPLSLSLFPYLSDFFLISLVLFFFFYLSYSPFLFFFLVYLDLFSLIPPSFFSSLPPSFLVFSFLSLTLSPLSLSLNTFWWILFTIYIEKKRILKRSTKT